MLILVFLLVFLPCLSRISLYCCFCMEPPNISLSAHMLAQWVAIKDYRVMQFLQGHSKIQVGVQTITKEVL